jgi:hypothetical protein
LQDGVLFAKVRAFMNVIMERIARSSSNIVMSEVICSVSAQFFERGYGFCSFTVRLARRSPTQLFVHS